MDKQIEKIVDQIERVLLAQLSGHEQLLELLHRKRMALARADHAEMTECCRLENQKLQAIAELEKQRQTLSGELTLLLSPGAAAPLRLVELAERLAEPARGRLLVLRQKLRQRMEKVGQEAGVARRAAEALSRHMQGIIQNISAACAGGGVYGRAGAPVKTAMGVRTFNTTA